MKAFVISDVHGCYNSFSRMLRNWDRNDLLVILGDCIDRGNKSLDVIQELMIFKRHYGDRVIVLKGNHEDMFLEFLSNPKENWQYLDHGGADTITSFLQDMDVLLSYTNEECVLKLMNTTIEEIDFIRQMPHFYQFGNVLFTHAGFQSLYKNWENTSDLEYIWIRNHYRHKNETGLINVFGHTLTDFIHNSNDIWVSKCNTYIGIDGGCVFGGQLNGLLISDKGEILNTYRI